MQSSKVPEGTIDILARSFPQTEKLRVVIADDERPARSFLEGLLRSFDDVKLVGTAANGVEAVTLIESKKTDLALLDVDMPKMDGIKAARLIAAVSPRTKILMLSVHHEDEKINAATRAGAIGYILKDTDRAEFINIIRQTHAGKIVHSPYLAHLALEHFDQVAVEQRNVFDLPEGALNGEAVVRLERVLVPPADAYEEFRGEWILQRLGESSNDGEWRSQLV